VRGKKGSGSAAWVSGKIGARRRPAGAEQAPAGGRRVRRGGEVAQDKIATETWTRKCVGNHPRTVLYKCLHIT
jgi:hypothetical protein